MQMPLVVTEQETYRMATIFYPQVDVIYKDLSDLSLAYLAEHFDALFESGKFFAAQLQPFLSLVCKKKMRFIFCPHGNSDKGHSLQTQIQQDISLVYADHMIDLLKRTGALQHIQQIVKTGNYRLPFYLSHQSFYDKLAQERFGIYLDPTKKTILYAPTWQDGENPTSFFSSTHALIHQLLGRFNLIIKVHPFLEEFHPAHTYHILSQYEKTPGVIFLQNFPSIYPLLQKCDAYVGDYSSIGYDFLYFNRPLYFLPGKNKTFSLLHDCGVEILLESNIGSVIENTWEDNQMQKESQRRKVYDYAFGKQRKPEEIREEILKLLT
jgi:hypothetical protein